VSICHRHITRSPGHAHPATPPQPIVELVLTQEADGAVAWRSPPPGAALPMLLRLCTLPPGRTLRLRRRCRPADAAGGPLPPGTYLLRAALLAEPAPLVAPPVPLQILPR
jgi:hypothetical protein